jgi:hypothetical protein
LERLVEFHVVHGHPAALCPLLHLGESPSLSMDERRSVAERVVLAAAGQVPVWVHVSAPSTAAQIELAQHAEQIGAKAIVAAAPYYQGLAADSLASHFAELSGAVRISVILYNSPGQACGPALPPTMIGRLAAEHTNIVGLKDASFDARYWIEVPMPLTVGIEVSGFVRATGSGVENLLPGQPVAALLNNFVDLPGAGGYAEIARARADLTIPPRSIGDLTDAAAMLINGTTAWMAIHDMARVKSGESVLVLGATGGLGALLGQLAAKAGAGRVIGVIGSASKHEAALRLG